MTAESSQAKEQPLHRRLRYLWAFTGLNEAHIQWHNRLMQQRRGRGHDVENFCIPPVGPGGWRPFDEFDRRWQRGDPALYRVAEALVEKLNDRDVLILFGGTSLHPELIRSLNVLKVFEGNDDPESTEILTRPMAPAFDVHLVSNIAAVDMYRSWGLPRVHFWPLGSQVAPPDVSDLDESTIRSGRGRDIRLFMACERLGPWRRDRLDRLSREFPQARFAGLGWPQGYIGWDELWATYRRTQIGWNIHNSTGPINFRTYDLPAHGVLQICDNRSHLARLFDIGREVVGFETPDECTELTRYYLAHVDEQREVAYAGHVRWRSDYTPEAVWERLVRIVETTWVETRVGQRRALPLRILGPTRRALSLGRRVVNKARRVLLRGSATG
jgi:hypothetical protein